MYINKKIFKEMDYSILFSMIAICILGIISIGSATNAFVEGGNPKTFITQILWLVLSCIIGFIVLLVDYNTIGDYYKVIYIFTNILLVLVLVAGSERNGAKSWLGIGTFGIQPSEFAKVSLIIGLAKILEGMDNINTWKNMLKILIYVGIPMLLIKLEPDTGTNVIFLIIIAGMLFVAGLNAKIIWGVIGTGLLGFFGAYKFGKLQEHQMHRISVFLHPEMDRLGNGYNAYLAKIAVGSGMFFGRGINNSDLTRGEFIPYCHTDFIFSTFAEAFGFLGCIILLGFYFNLIYKSIKIANESKDKFGKYMVIGIVTMLTYQILQNIGMDIGIVPITGIPLPFMSYGGSSLLTNVIAIALVLNVGMRKKKINF
ncbi:MAG TPA: rod shape-determining protein RodA [Clostridiaceae bacterium]|nr:rod shape-determining protein RodA [Clostridiaceae bacterium]